MQRPFFSGKATWYLQLDGQKMRWWENNSINTLYEAVPNRALSVTLYNQHILWPFIFFWKSIKQQIPFSILTPPFWPQGIIKWMKEERSFEWLVFRKSNLQILTSWNQRGKTWEEIVIFPQIQNPSVALLCMLKCLGRALYGHTIGKS